MLVVMRRPAWGSPNTDARRDPVDQPAAQNGALARQRGDRLIHVALDTVLALFLVAVGTIAVFFVACLAFVRHRAGYAWRARART